MKLPWTAFALLLSLFVASSPRVALADPPPTQFTIQFDGDAAIWNPFEGFEACETVTELGSSATLCLLLNDVSCDGAGICAFDAVFEFSGLIDGVLTGSGTGKGSCKATPDDPDDDVCKAKLKLDASGVIAGQGVTCDAELSNLSVNGPVDHTGFFEGKAKSKLCLDCSNDVRVCDGVAGLFEYQLNPPIAWDLTVDLIPDPLYQTNLSGSATDDLGPYEYTATGKYNPTTDESTISLKGVTKKADPGSISQGAKIKLDQLDCAAGQCSGTATFKVQGNRVKDAPVAP